MTLRAKQWQQQFETLVDETEAYLNAHSFEPEHLKVCNALATFAPGNPEPEWTCNRMREVIVLCRQVLDKHRFREPIVVPRPAQPEEEKA